MRHRQNRKPTVALVRLLRMPRLHHILTEITMTQHDTLRLSRSAGSINDHREIVR